MKNNEIFNETLARVLGLKSSEINDTLSYGTCSSWDSITHMIIIDELESCFSVEFDPISISEIRTISDLKNKLSLLDVKL